MLSPQQKGAITKKQKYGEDYFSKHSKQIQDKYGFTHDPKERFLERIQIDEETGCWNWLGGKDRDGYGYFFDGTKQYKAHRYSYENFIGPIPEGLVLDHLCRNRACVNPDPKHLEPVTPLENLLRGEGFAGHALRTNTCQRGHLLIGNNVWIRKNGRCCAVCGRASNRASNQRKQHLIKTQKAFTVGNVNGGTD